MFLIYLFKIYRLGNMWVVKINVKKSLKTRIFPSVFICFMYFIWTCYSHASLQANICLGTLFINYIVIKFKKLRVQGKYLFKNEYKSKCNFGIWKDFAKNEKQLILAFISTITCKNAGWRDITNDSDCKTGKIITARSMLPYISSQNSTLVVGAGFNRIKTNFWKPYLLTEHSEKI